MGEARRGECPTSEAKKAHQVQRGSVTIPALCGRKAAPYPVPLRPAQGHGAHPEGHVLMVPIFARLALTLRPLRRLTPRAPGRPRIRRSASSRRFTSAGSSLPRGYIGMATVSKADAKAAGDHAGLPLILTLKEAAAVARRAPGTLKRLVSEGKFRKSAKRGKPLLFWRDAFLQEVMEDNDGL